MATAMRIRWRVIFFGLLAALAVAEALADVAEPTSDYADGTLTGDWAGRRSAWAAAGVNLDLGLKSDWLRTRGGQSTGGRPMNQLDVKVGADLDKLWGWSSTRAFVHFLYDWGDAVNAGSIHSLIGVSNIEWPIATSRFFQAWIEKRLIDDSLGVLVGLYPFDSEFSALDSAAVLLNPSFGASPDISLTRGPSIFNNASFGLRLKWHAAASPLYAQAALLDGVPGDPMHPKGTHVKFGRGDGSFHIVETGYLADGDGFSKFALGAWGYTARVADLVDVDAVGDPIRRRSRGWYALTEQTFWRHNEADLAAFARYCATDGDSTAIVRAANLGLNWRAPLAARRDDIAAIGITRATMGAKFRALAAARGNEAMPDESIVEATYRIAVTRMLAIQPTWQRIRHPGAARTGATVVGVRFELAL